MLTEGSVVQQYVDVDADKAHARAHRYLLARLIDGGDYDVGAAVRPEAALRERSYGGVGDCEWHGTV